MVYPNQNANITNAANHRREEMMAVGEEADIWQKPAPAKSQSINALDDCHKRNWSLINRQSLRCYFRFCRHRCYWMLFCDCCRYYTITLNHFIYSASRYWLFPTSRASNSRTRCYSSANEQTPTKTEFTPIWRKKMKEMHWKRECHKNSREKKGHGTWHEQKKSSHSSSQFIFKSERKIIDGNAHIARIFLKNVQNGRGSSGCGRAEIYHT